eukprot:6162972-Amphidinium_carterae.1
MAHKRCPTTSFRVWRSQSCAPSKELLSTMMKPSTWTSSVSMCYREGIQANWAPGSSKTA